MPLKPVSCPKCSGTRIAADFPAIDRREVLGFDAEYGRLMLSDDADVDDSDGDPNLCCRDCLHTWELVDDYDFGGDDD